ncbi:MAG TPA: hypothetical protein DCX14_08410 [Flavobacteriales bacterium]|jgi:hypothetical protein|nr:hypothetical protein [Flavobacteriales bacterium]
MKISELKPIFIQNSKVPILLSYLAPINIGAITLGFIVFSRGEVSPKTRQHETIHFQQFLETLFIGFFVLYAYDYIKNYINYRDGSLAYYNIRAEKEAYQHDETEDYLTVRRRWRWILWK